MLVHRIKVEEDILATANGPLKLEWVLPEWLALLPAEARAEARQLPRRRYRRIVLYMHGGAYVLCTPGSLRGCTAPIAHALDAALCVPEYRRPPEHSLSCAIEDGFEAYRHLLREYPDSEIVIAGESAGGGLAASMLLALRGGPLPMPSSALLMSPWSDTSGEGSEAGLMHVGSTRGSRDYLPLGLVNMFAGLARGDLPQHEAPASPLYAAGSLADLPPIFVLYGLDEVLCGQIEHFVARWRGHGARISELGVEGGVHAPVLFSFCHVPSRDALQELNRFFSFDPERVGADTSSGPPAAGGEGGDGGRRQAPAHAELMVGLVEAAL